MSRRNGREQLGGAVNGAYSFEVLDLPTLYLEILLGSFH